MVTGRAQVGPFERGTFAMTRVAANAPRVADHFEGRAPVVRAIYDRLLAVARRLGSVDEDPKKTSIHLNRKSAFAGVATRKSALVVTIKAEEDIKSPRIAKHLKASPRRWYLDVRLESVDEVDAEFTRWLRKSYELSV
jgi:hypothetical protein